MELIENYLDDYNSIMETLNHKLDESKSQFGSEWQWQWQCAT